MPIWPSEVADVGVILLMFGVGLHFSPKDLLSVRAVAVPVALLQIVAGTAAGIGLAMALGWSIETGVVLGLALSVSSTVVALRSLQERRLMATERGKLAVGWLVVEDLAMVVAMVLLPTWAHIRSQVENGEGISALQMQDAGLAVALTLGKVALFALIMLLAGKRVVPWLLHRVVHMGSRELFRLAVLAIALGRGVRSFGAVRHFGGAGRAVRRLDHGGKRAVAAGGERDAAAARTRSRCCSSSRWACCSIRRYCCRNPWPLLATVGIILVFRSLVSVGLLRIVRAIARGFGDGDGEPGADRGVLVHPRGAGASVRADPGRGARSDAGRGDHLDRAEPTDVCDLRSDREEGGGHRSGAAGARAVPVQPKRAVLVGYGRVGSLIGKALDDAHATYSVIEDREDLVEQLQAPRNCCRMRATPSRRMPCKRPA